MALRRAASFRAVVAVGCVLGCPGCGHTPTYDQGLAKVTGQVDATIDHLSPRPNLPAPSDDTDEGSCAGLTGDTHGTLLIVRHYQLGAVPIPRSDAWIDQAQQYWTARGYDVGQLGGGPGLKYRGVNGQDRNTGVLLALTRANGVTVLLADSPCVSARPSASPT